MITVEDISKHNPTSATWDLSLRIAEVNYSSYL